jgi:LysM repeat protein
MVRWYFQRFGALIVTIVLLVVTFTGLGFIVFSVLVNSNASRRLNLDYAAIDRPEATLVFEGTPDPSAKLDFKDTALGVSLAYPHSWLKSERGLEVAFSPTLNGLDPAGPGNVALWIGIPPDNITSATDLLASLRERLAPNGRILSRRQITVGGQPWRAVEMNFENKASGETIRAQLATTQYNEVPYYFIAMAPLDTWSAVQPHFAQILKSLHFTEEAVLRPTDVTPLTPTPSPTPVVHVVEPGDTLDDIAILYDVDPEMLAARNGIDDPLSLQTGEKLIIPIRRR